MISGDRLSQSVTPSPLLAAKMLQIKTNRAATKVPVPNVVVFDKKEAAPIKRGGIKQVYFWRPSRPNENAEM